jgi:hypothetical protein
MIKFPKIGLSAISEIKLPLTWVERLCWLRLVKRPHFLCADVSDSPEDSEMKPNVLYREIRKSFPKWAHFTCPRCSERIQVPIAASPNNWILSTDWLNRPTLNPSIWETRTCGAHFIVKGGELIWCHA